MKEKVIKQTLSIVVELRLKEILTELAQAKRTTPSKLCASILEEYVQVRGRGMTFKQASEAKNVKPVFTAEDEARTQKIIEEVDESIDQLFSSTN